MSSRTFARSLILALVIAGPAAADSAIVWDEAASRDLSNDPVFPDAVTLRATTNDVRASLFPTFPGTDPRDEFTFTILSGETLTGIFLDAYDPTDGNTSTGFTLYAGNQGQGAAPRGSQLTSTAFTVAVDLYKTNLLKEAGPLGPGVYTVSVRDFTAVTQPQRYYLSLIFDYESISRNSFETGDLFGWDEVVP